MRQGDHLDARPRSRTRRRTRRTSMEASVVRSARSPRGRATDSRRREPVFAQESSPLTRVCDRSSRVPPASSRSWTEPAGEGNRRARRRETGAEERRTQAREKLGRDVYSDAGRPGEESDERRRQRDRSRSKRPARSDPRDRAVAHERIEACSQPARWRVQHLDVAEAAVARRLSGPHPSCGRRSSPRLREDALAAPAEISLVRADQRAVACIRAPYVHLLATGGHECRNRRPPPHRLTTTGTRRRLRHVHDRGREPDRVHRRLRAPLPRRGLDGRDSSRRSAVPRQ